MKYLTVKNVLLLHQMQIEEFGGTHGLRDLGLLESAVMRPKTTFDGNKRTAMFSVMTFIELNEYKFIIKKEEVVDYALYIENSQPEIKEISAWLKNHSTKNL